MPSKQTKESIEAELNAGEKERVVRKLHDLALECREFEKHLQEMEREAGLPTSPTTSLVERLAALGASQKVIDDLQTFLDALPKIAAGRADELPDHLKEELAMEADAELTGAELLAGIVTDHRKA